jgi:hypothetical protein
MQAFSADGLPGHATVLAPYAHWRIDEGGVTSD